MTDAHAAITRLLGSLDFEATVGLITPKGELLAAYGDLDKAYPLASVSKLVSTYAALIAIDRGTLSLTDSAGEGTPDGCTVEHLLSHSAGYAFEGGEFLAKPGQRRMYTNAGIEQLGRVVSDAVGAPFDQWVREVVIEPLGMDGLEVVGSPAKDYRGTLNDILVLGHEFLTPTLISEDLAAEAHRPHFPDLAGVLPGYGRQDPNEWGLGTEIKGSKTPHWTGAKNSSRTFGHFGQSGSYLWVDPEAGRDGLAAAFLSNKNFCEDHAKIWPDLGDLLVSIGEEER